MAVPCYHTTMLSLIDIYAFFKQEYGSRAKTKVFLITSTGEPILRHFCISAIHMWSVSFPIIKTSVPVHTTDLAFTATDGKNNLIWHVVKYKRSMRLAANTVRYGVESMDPMSH